MKCNSYDYDFEMDLVAKWKALDRPAPRPSGSRPKGNVGHRRKLPAPMTDDSEEDNAPTRRSRGHLSRKARPRNCPLKIDDSVLAMDSGSELTSDEDDEDLYHDADVGDL